MNRENIKAALDIGTSRITALVGEMDSDGRVYVIGHGSRPADGLRRGVVVDMEKAVQSIQGAVTDAAMVSGTEVDRVTVGIAGEHIRSINSSGVIAVNRADNEITEADVAKVLEAARTVAIPVDREIIHVVPQEFAVDEQAGIKDPVGMTGVRLEVEAHIVTASVTTARNLYRALERCRLDLDHIVLESLAQAETLLSAEEIESGTVVVDIGGELSNISVYYDGAIRHTAVIPLGGKNVTNDIAIGLRTTVDEAEAIKTGHGAALSSMVDPEEMIPVKTATAGERRPVSRHVLASIIEPRMEEIFSLIVRVIKQAQIPDVLTGGLLLCGGGALLPGTVNLAEQLLDMPVRIGRIRHIEHTPDELQSVRYATVHGLLRYAFLNEPDTAEGTGFFGRLLKKCERWISKQF